MRLALILRLIFGLSVPLQAQFGQQQIITDEALAVELVIAVDIDGDGDMDIASASRGSHTIAWQENVDGTGIFGPQQIVSEIINETEYVYAADLDGDVDMDLLAYSGPDNLIVWFENLDGLGNFGPQRTINANTVLPGEIVAADIDGDADLDVIVSSRGENAVIWFENTNGLGDFGPKQVVTNNAMSGFSVYAADLDGDMDIDLIATSSGDKRLYWYENQDGLGNFGPDQLIVETTEFGGFISVFALDIDGDGDKDILAAEFGGDTLSWFENTDGQGDFGPQQFITTTLITPFMVFAIDLDNDGDPDILSASGTDDKVVWFENMDGLGTFGPEKVITTLTDNPRSVYAADLDGDGDNDVLSASIADDTIAWYENFTVLNAIDQMAITITLYPNPVGEKLYVQAEEIESIDNMVLLDTFGRVVLEKEEVIESMDVSNLISGIYFIQINTASGSVTKKIIKE